MNLKTSSRPVVVPPVRTLWRIDDAHYAYVTPTGMPVLIRNAKFVPPKDEPEWYEEARELIKRRGLGPKDA